MKLINIGFGNMVSAERMLIDADVRRDKRKKVIDKVAATIILQSYLDSHR